MGEPCRAWFLTKASLQDAEEGEGKLRSWCPSNGSENYGAMKKVRMLGKLILHQNRV